MLYQRTTKFHISSQFSLVYATKLFPCNAYNLYNVIFDSYFMNVKIYWMVWLYQSSWHKQMKNYITDLTLNLLLSILPYKFDYILEWNSTIAYILMSCFKSFHWQVEYFIAKINQNKQIFFVFLGNPISSAHIVKLPRSNPIFRYILMTFNNTIEWYFFLE